MYFTTYKRSLLFLLLGVSVLACEPELPVPESASDVVIPQERRVIVADNAPAAVGPYSQAIEVGRTLYMAGQVGLDPSTGTLVEGGIEAETRQVMANCEAVLAAAGYSFADVVQAQVFLADIADYAAMNAIYASYFGEAPPARAAVQVARLPLDARVEIMLTAAK